MVENIVELTLSGQVVLVQDEQVGVLSLQLGSWGSICVGNAMRRVSESTIVKPHKIYLRIKSRSCKYLRNQQS